MKQQVPDILKKIVKTKQQEVKAYTKTVDDFKHLAADMPPAKDFQAALAGPELAIIAEVKKASPSAGIIATNFEPEKIAQAYQTGKADAISVLTDIDYFKGSPDYIPRVRKVTEVPILRKDFIIDPIQIAEARALGADSFLLIAAILSTTEMEDFINIGRSLGMEPLIEVHDEIELEKALEATPRIIGVNNRNLHTFEVTLDTSFRLKSQLPKSCVTVSESGIFTTEQAQQLAHADFNALLIGQSLMEAGLDNCGTKIEQFKGRTNS